MKDIDIQNNCNDEKSSQMTNENFFFTEYIINENNNDNEGNKISIEELKKNEFEYSEIKNEDQISNNEDIIKLKKNELNKNNFVIVKNEDYNYLYDLNKYPLIIFLEFKTNLQETKNFNLTIHIQRGQKSEIYLYNYFETIYKSSNEVNKSNKEIESYIFKCYDPNCKGLSKLLLNNDPKNCFIQKEKHSIKYEEHNFVKCPTKNQRVFIKLMQTNLLLSNIQIVEVPLSYKLKENKFIRNKINSPIKINDESSIYTEKKKNNKLLLNNKKLFRDSFSESSRYQMEKCKKQDDCYFALEFVENLKKEKINENFEKFLKILKENIKFYGNIKVTEIYLRSKKGNIFKYRIANFLQSELMLTCCNKICKAWGNLSFENWTFNLSYGHKIKLSEHKEIQENEYLYNFLLKREDIKTLIVVKVQQDKI